MDYNKARNLGFGSFIIGSISIIGLLSIIIGYDTIIATIIGIIARIIISIVGIILGVKARKILDEKNEKLALVGVVCSSIAIMINVITIIDLIFFDFFNEKIQWTMDIKRYIEFLMLGR